MALKITSAKEADADRIADIHVAVFGTSISLLAQLPIPAIRGQLRERIAEKAAADIRDPNIAVPAMRDQGQIVGFA